MRAQLILVLLSAQVLLDLACAGDACFVCAGDFHCHCAGDSELSGQEPVLSANLSHHNFEFDIRFDIQSRILLDNFLTSVGPTVAHSWHTF